MAAVYDEPDTSHSWVNGPLAGGRVSGGRSARASHGRTSLLWAVGLSWADGSGSLVGGRPLMGGRATRGRIIDVVALY